ncbi:MAG: AarF/ABC1/UbiB kinase family protein [Saprospiraceae bacterium]|nr:AarF/ABC1/UbiB kinase family protein [Saprospiraceae bacterium]
MHNIFSPRYRIRKAYWTATIVMGSYLIAMFLRRFLGRKWYERRLEQLHVANAERVKKSILGLQGLFIKVGQLLSIMSNFLPEKFQQPLEALQDRLPPQPIEKVRLRIREEFGREPEDLFAEFEAVAIASASIGQAHLARLPDGTQVVVKVQHYGIESVVKVDLDIIQRLTRIIAWFMEIKGMDYLYSQIRKMIEEECDFTNEARAMERIRINLAAEQGITVPVVHPEYSTGKVLTTTFCQGVKISDTAMIDEWGLDRRELAAKLLRVWCKMILQDGYYHADPHPGNILVDQNGALTLLDFGATAVLPLNMREGIGQLIEAAVKNDNDAMLDACRKIGLLAEGPEAERMAKKMINALRNFLQNEIQFEGLNFRDVQVNPFNNSLADLISDIGLRGISGTIQIPKEYVLLNRTITLLLGISNTLDPLFNPLDVIRPFMQDYILKGKGGVVGYLRHYLQNTVTTTLALPDELQRTLRKARSGELDFRTPDIEAGARRIARAVGSVAMAILAVGLAFFSLTIRDMGMEEESRWGFGAAAFLAVWVIFRRG